jgi:hypothetical protein
MPNDSTRSKPASREEILARYHDRVRAYCSKQMDAMFQRAGAALLEFADRAESDAVQSQFFDAISRINKGRDGMKRHFLAELEQGFERFGNLAPPSIGIPDDSEQLTLLSPEEMEESVASENITIKANASYFPELYTLSRRLAVINDGQQLRDYEIPAGPHHLVQSFRRSLRTLGLDIKVKIVLYALFDKLFMRGAQPFYQGLNEVLTEAGILPHIRPVGFQKGRQGRLLAAKEERADTEDSGSARDAESLGEELFDSILELMSSTRVGPRTDHATPPLAREQIEAAFEQLKVSRAARPTQAADAVPGGRAALSAEEWTLRPAKQRLSDEREQLLEALDRDRLAPLDSDLIDLIGLLFEYMLNDPILPNAAKASISRLHTPYLKVALIDRRLLVSPTHTARRLLNELVEAGSQWVDESNPNHGIFPQIQRTVDRALQEFDSDVALFDELCDELERAVAEQRRRTELLERRSREAAEGRERLQLAKRRAALAIEGLVRDRPVPGVVLAFLRGVWLDVLALVLLRHRAGDQSDAWNHALGTAEQLLALFDAASGDGETAQSGVSASEVRARIGSQVRGIGAYDRALVDALGKALDDPGSVVEPGPPAPVGGPGAPAAEPIDRGGDYVGQPSSPPPDAELEEEEQAMVERLRALKFGTWLEWDTGDGGGPRRAKLASISLLTSTCRLVDRAGVHSEVKTLRDLARELLDGKCRLLPKQRRPFVERTLVSIHDALRGNDAAAADGVPASATD